MPAYEDNRAYRITFFGDEIERITDMNPLLGEINGQLTECSIYPAKHYITQDEKLKKSIQDIEDELEERLKYYKAEGRLLEAQRIEQRTRYDLEMLREVGYCSGIENYSRLAGPAPRWFAALDIDRLPAARLPVVHR